MAAAQGGPPVVTAWGLGSALLVYPVLEEFIFRGQVLPALTRRFPAWRPWQANLATSLLFGAAHLPWWPLAHAAAVVAPSMVLGLLMQRTGRLAWCVAAHAAMNAAYVAWWAWSPLVALTPDLGMAWEVGAWVDSKACL